MARSHPLQTEFALLALMLGLTATPARAVWGPDSVLTLGSTNRTTAGLVPSAGNDVYVYWSWGPGNGVLTYVARVTPDGGLAFTGYLHASSAFAPQPARFPVAPDGLGGLIDAWTEGRSEAPYYNDIAYRYLRSDGTYEPAGPSTYWANETSTYEYIAAVATGPAGGAYIGWVDEDFRPTLQRVTAAGSVAPGWPANGRALTPYTYSGRDHALLPDGAGGTYVLYYTGAIRVQRVQSDNTLAPGWPLQGLFMKEYTPFDPYAPYALSLVASGTDHAFAVWAEAASYATRIMVQYFTAAGQVEWPEGGEVELVPPTEGVSSVNAQSDGQDGLLVTWTQSGAFEVAHFWFVTSVSGRRGTQAATRSMALTKSGAVVSGGAVAPGRNAGFIVFRADASGILATWYLADFTLDPSEPVNPRVVHANAPGYAAYPTAAMSDGDGGALLVFHDGLSYENSKVAKMRHVFRSGVLDAVGPPRVSGLALSLAPNPARTELTLDLALVMDGPARIELLDVSGRRLLSRAIASGPGARRERLELPVGLAPGVYVARLTQGFAARARRFAVVR